MFLVLNKQPTETSVSSRVKSETEVPTLPTEIILKHIFPFLQWRNEENKNKREIPFIINAVEYTRDGVEDGVEFEQEGNWGKRYRANHWGNGFNHF